MEKLEMFGEIWIDKVKPDPNNPRKKFDEQELKELSEGIKEHGVINPIEIDENNMIIDGERRWRASKMAKLTKIPFKRKIMNGTEKKAPGYRIEEQLQANLTGRNLDISEARESIEALLAANNAHFARGGKPREVDEPTLTKLAKKLGVSRVFLSQILKMDRQATTEVKDAVKNNLIPFSTAVEIASVQDKEVQKDFLDYANVEELTRDEVREIAKEIKDKPKEEAKEILETHRAIDPAIEETAKSLNKIFAEMGNREKNYAFGNFLFMKGIQNALDKHSLYCPKCGKKTGSLKWTCCNTILERSIENESKSHEKCG